MRVRRVLRMVVLLALVVVLAGSGYVGWVLVQRSEPVDMPTPTGAYAVGRTSYEWTDAARKDPFSPGGSAPRRLAVWVWYPVSPGATGARAQYAPGPWSGLHLPVPVSVFQGPFDTLRNHALDNAPIAPSRFPVVVLSPGMGLSALQYTALAEELASHGYVVAGLTPTYSANLTVLGDEKVTSTKQANPGDLGTDTPQGIAEGNRIVAVWAADARFVGKTMLDQDSGDGLLSGRVDTASKVSYAGHSFGGAASLEACRLDPRCGGAIDLDGSQFGEVVTKGVKAPILLLGSEDSCITGTCGAKATDTAVDRARAQSLLRASTATKWCATIDGARHFNFTDYGAYYLALPLRKYLPLGSIGPRRALTIQNGYVITFLDHTIRKVPAPGAPACRLSP